MTDQQPPVAPDVLAALSDRLADAFEALGAAVVAVRGRDRGGAASGVVWRPGLVVTAEEAMERDDGLGVVLPDGSGVGATLVGRDPTTDVALLRVEGPGSAAVGARGDLAGVRPGALALLAGRREAGNLAARLAAVATVGPAWRSAAGGEIDRLVTLDATVDRRGEGGLVADARGAVMGMAVAGPRRRALVIPAATIDRAVDRLLAHGRVARGYLGLGLRPVRLDEAAAAALSLPEPRGLIVVGVDPDGPGRRAGVVLGDVVATWDGAPVAGMRQLMARLGPESVGREARLGLVRAGAPAEATLTVGERAAAAAA